MVKEHKDVEVKVISSQNRGGGGESSTDCPSLRARQIFDYSYRKNINPVSCKQGN